MRGSVQFVPSSLWLFSRRTVINCRAGNGLAKDQTQFRGVLAGRFRQKIIAQIRGIEFGDRVALGNGEAQFPQGRFADVQFNFIVNCQFVFTAVIREDVRHGQLRENLIGAKAQREVRRGKAEGEPLAALGMERRSGDVVFGELIGRNLGHAAGLRDLQPHRAFVDNAEITRKPDGIFQFHLENIHRLWEGAKRGLRLCLKLKLIFLGLVKLNDEAAIRGIGNRLNLPGEHTVALNTGDFAVAVQQD